MNNWIIKSSKKLQELNCTLITIARIAWVIGNKKKKEIFFCNFSLFFLTFFGIFFKYSFYLLCIYTYIHRNRVRITMLIKPTRRNRFFPPFKRTKILVITAIGFADDRVYHSSLFSQSLKESFRDCWEMWSAKLRREVGLRFKKSKENKYEKQKEKKF